MQVRQGTAVLSADMREGEKMEPASDSNLSLPPRGVRRALQLGLFPLQMEGERIEESRESIPEVWKRVSEREWNDWRWQLRHRITTLEQLKEIIDLTPEEVEGIKHSKGRLALAVTPYFASLMDPINPNCPIRRQAVPRIEEIHFSKSEMVDPLGEDNHSPVPGLVHRYPDRVLLLVTDQCAVYCRYCTRRRLVGSNEKSITQGNFEEVVKYLKGHRKVRDVLLSGGDPLLLENERLEEMLSRLRAIPHIEVLRIGTRVPVTLPQRITGGLVRMLKKYHPLLISIHFTHPKEVTDQVRRACSELADGGFPLGSQTVLLKGINDKPYIMKKLLHELLKVRVRPYYIYQCDLAMGTEHFRTSVATGIQIMEKLRGHTTGYAVPTYVVDAPGGGGKIPLQPDYVVSKGRGKIVLRNYEGRVFEYPEPNIIEFKKTRPMAEEKTASKKATA
ncbi:MAG TPA: lysine 2,3-aminomutase [Thermodesulfobacteriota bacterium]|nr:lysine 2,3-aminomutase [Thermodesulfobacteriota bacterium]